MSLVRMLEMLLVILVVMMSWMLIDVVVACVATLVVVIVEIVKTRGTFYFMHSKSTVLVAIHHDEFLGNRFDSDALWGSGFWGRASR